MNVVVAIVVANLRRLRNDRTSLFFLVIVPLLIVYALGAAIGGATQSTLIGVVDPQPTSATKEVRTALAGAADVRLVQVSDAGALRDALARRELDGGYVVTRRDGITTFGWMASATSPEGFHVAQVMAAAVTREGLRQRAVEVVATGRGTDRVSAAAALERANAEVTRTRVRVTALQGAGDEPKSVTAVLAGGQLTLFIFLASLFGASNVLQARQFGVTRRMRAGPVTDGLIITGEAVSRFITAALQALIIVGGTVALFHVDWGSPAAVAALSAGMALVGTGAAMLLGVVARTEQQIGGVAMGVGLVMAALGGSMQPLHYFPDAIRPFAFITPHAWMNDALWDVQVNGAGLGAVWGNVVVLGAAGTVLLAVAVLAMRRRMG